MNVTFFSVTSGGNGRRVERETSKQTYNTKMSENHHEATEYMNTTNEALEKPLLAEHTIYLCDLGAYINNKLLAEFEDEFKVSVI